MSLRHEIAGLLRAVRRAGCPVDGTGAGHWRIRPPAGPVIFVSSTPSDRRSVRNIRAMLRRAGVALGKQRRAGSAP